MKLVITWQSPSEARISICRECEEQFREKREWPKDQRGHEHCQVYHGEHEGRCDVCEQEEA